MQQIVHIHAMKLTPVIIFGYQIVLKPQHKRKQPSLGASAEEKSTAWISHVGPQRGPFGSVSLTPMDM